MYKASLSKIILITFLSQTLNADVNYLQKFIYKAETSINQFNAVAIDENTLITSYHGVDDIKQLKLSNEKNTFNATIDKVAIANDLASLKIKDSVDSIAFSKEKPKIGDTVDIVGYDSFITTKIHDITDDSIVFNLAVASGVSGSGVFLNNKLIGVILRVDILSNSTYASKVSNIDQVVEPHKMIKMPSTKLKNHDTSYCNDPEQLEAWRKITQTTNLEIHKLHAIFIGLCQKVKNRDLTTDEAAVIFDSTKEEIAR